MLTELPKLRLLQRLNRTPARRLSELTGINLLRVERLLRGERKPRPGELEALRDALLRDARPLKLSERGERER